MKNKKKKQKSAYSSSSTQNKTKSNKLKTGLAIGGISLAVLALAGGLTTFLVSKNKNVEIDNKPGVSQEVDYTEYNLPDEFNYVSVNRVELNDNFSLFYSSSVGTYLLNENTKEFKFLNSNYVSSYYVNGDKAYIVFNNNKIHELDLISVDFISLDSVMSAMTRDFNSLTFLGVIDDNMIFKGSYTAQSGSSGVTKYVLEIFNMTASSINEIELENATMSSNIKYVFDVGDYYWFTYVYDNSSSSSRDSYFVNKETFELNTIEGYYAYSSNGNFVVKDNYLYAYLRKSTSRILGKVDLSSFAVTELLTSSVPSSMIDVGSGILFGNEVKVNNTSYSTGYCKYLSYTDSTLTSIGDITDSSGYFVRVNGRIFVMSSNHDNVYVYNEQGSTFDTLITFNHYSGSNLKTIVDFNGTYFIGNTNAGFFKLIFGDDGSISTQKSEFNFDGGYNSVNIKDNKYLFIDKNYAYVSYYDVDLDMEVEICNSSSYGVSSYEITDNYVYIYCDNHLKYEFDLNKLITKTVAYWE